MVQKTKSIRNQFEGAAIKSQELPYDESMTLEDLKIATLKHYNQNAGSQGIPEEDWEYYVLNPTNRKCPNQSKLVIKYEGSSFLRLEEQK